MKAMILAAGYGTRLRPVTYALPKPMVPLCNRPLIGWAVESFLASGVRDFIVNVHHLPEAIEAYLRERYAQEATFEFSYETEILGTGGGVRRVRPLLANESDFFLMNGDTIQFVPAEALKAARRNRNAIAALTLRHPPAGDRFTAVYFRNGKVTGFGQGSGEPLMFAGSHLISSRIFEHLPDKEFSGIVDEVYMPLIATSRETVAGVVDDGVWFDIGTPQRYMGASRALLALSVNGMLAPARGTETLGDSLVHESASIPGTIVQSVVGERSVIEGTLRDSVVWDDCHVAPGAVLESCIVAHGVRIPSGAKLTNQILCRDEAVPPDAEGTREHGLVMKAI